MKVARLIIAVFLVACLGVNAWGETFYVRDSSSGEYGAEDGTSYENAFDGFADIVWGSGAGQVGAGDTLYICDTIDGEKLTVSGSGSGGNVITIRGDYPGHAGIIDGTGQTECIYNNGYDYITITHLDVRNSLINIECAGVTDNIVCSYITSSGTNGGTCADFWASATSNTVTVDHWTIAQGEDYTIVFFGTSAVAPLVNGTISNCTFNGAAGKVFTTGCYLRYINGLTISGNTVKDWTLNATESNKLFYIKDVAGIATVSSNIIGGTGDACEGRAFWFEDCATVVCSGNVIQNQQSVGIYAKNITTSIAMDGDILATNTFNNALVVLDSGVVAFVFDGINVSGALSSGVITASGSGTITDSIISDNGQNGVYVTTTGTVSMIGCTTNSNDEDGVNLNSAGTVNCSRCVSNFNGKTTVASSGDGYTAHLTGIMNLANCVGAFNFKSGAAMTQDSSGTIYNCTFYNNYEASQSLNDGIWINATGDWVIKNNTCSRNGTEITVTVTALAGAGTKTLDYNCYGTDSTYWSSGRGFIWTGTYVWSDYLANNGGQETHSMNADPQFVNASTGDFRLLASSPARNAGSNAVWSGTPNVTDLAGTAITDASGNIVAPGGVVDIGAYEFLGGGRIGTSPRPSSGVIRWH